MSTVQVHTLVQGITRTIGIQEERRALLLVCAVQCSIMMMMSAEKSLESSNQTEPIDFRGLGGRALPRYYGTISTRTVAVEYLVQYLWYL